MYQLSNDTRQTFMQCPRAIYKIEELCYELISHASYSPNFVLSRYLFSLSKHEIIVRWWKICHQGKGGGRDWWQVEGAYYMKRVPNLTTVTRRSVSNWKETIMRSNLMMGPEVQLMLKNVTKNLVAYPEVMIRSSICPSSIPSKNLITMNVCLS